MLLLRRKQQQNDCEDLTKRNKKPGRTKKLKREIIISSRSRATNQPTNQPNFDKLLDDECIASGDSLGGGLEQEVLKTFEVSCLEKFSHQAESGKHSLLAVKSGLGTPPQIPNV